MSSNPSRLAKKAARKKYGSTDGPSDTGAHPISTPGLSSGEDSSVVPSTRGPDSSTGIPTGGTVHLRNLATKSARKVTTALPSTASRHSTIDDDSDPPSTRSLSLSDTTTGVGTRPLSVAVKASRKVAFRDLPPASSRRSDVELSAPSGHHGRILASDELTTHRPQDRAGAMLSRTDQRNGQSQGTRISDRRARDLGDYRPSRSTTTTDIATAEQRKWMNRHISRELIPDGVTRQRVSRIATGRQSKKTGAEEQGRNTGGRHFRVSKRKSYLVEGKFVSPRPDGSSSTNDDTSDESEESTEGQPERAKVDSKAARKVQFGVKSGRPKAAVKRTAHQDEQHENLRDDSEQEDMSLYDTGDRSRTHDIVGNDVAAEPTHSTHPRLPFLRRNVREGFKHRCNMLGVDPNKTSPPIRPVSVTYPCLPSNTEEQGVPATSKASVRSWSCVMCDLHGVFNNRTVLHKHLSWDHPEIDVKWNTDYSELLLLKRDAPITLATARSVAVAPPVIEEDKKLKFTSSTESTERRPTPSVVGNFGPTAKYPFIPESSDIYSCRPGGPRLYDILNALPLEPFGVLSWVVVDREEELFELDDVLDEDKVMLALWYRWIFLNRNKFIASYFNGAKAFVTENWKLIRQAAGVAALRTWLLVLCVNNFLLPLEVVSLMQYYQSLAETEHASS